MPKKTGVTETDKTVIKVNKRMSEDLIKIIARYNEILSIDISEGQRTCSRCQKRFNLTSFPKSKNPLMHNQRIGVCKACINVICDFTEFGEAQYILSLLHLPFVEEIWEKSQGQEFPVSYYIKTMNLGQYVTLETAMIHRIKSYSSALDHNPYQARFDLLTDDERGYLAAKWGYEYYEADPLDCMKMEEFYNDMIEDFDITTRSHEDYLLKICRVSVAMDKALADSNHTLYKTLSKIYDDLSKSANFAESKSKDKKESAGFNAVSLLVEMAEKKGFIPIYHDEKEEDPDIVDKTIKNIKSWMHNLVTKETDLSQLLENAAARVIELDKKENKTNEYEYIPGLSEELSVEEGETDAED